MNDGTKAEQVAEGAEGAARLDFSPEDFAALGVRAWAPIPARLRDELRTIQNQKREAVKNGAEQDVKLAEKRERSILALPWLAVGVCVPDSRPDDDYLAPWLDCMENVRGMVRLRKPPSAKKANSLRRMEEAALRAARLCGDEDATAWIPKVRKIGTARFLAVLEKAERMQRDVTPDKDGRPISNWPAYFDAMLEKASGVPTKPQSGAVPS